MGIGVAFMSGCHPRHGVHVGHSHAHVGTEESVHDKRFDWFQGLRSDCVHRHMANACFKTGQNLEDGVVAPANEHDAHWYYAEACALQRYDQYCYAADRTAPQHSASQPAHPPSEQEPGAVHHHDAER
jgi:hypothetical protein